MHISSVVCSPCVTRLGGELGLSGLASVLSYLAVISIVVPFFKTSGAVEKILALPFEIPVFDPDEGNVFALGSGGVDFHLSADEVHVRDDANDCDVCGSCTVTMRL